MDVVGRKVRSKFGEQLEGTIVGVKHNLVSVSFVHGGSIDIPIDVLDIDEELTEELLKQMHSSYVTSHKESNKKYPGKPRYISPKIMTTPSMVYFNVAYMKFYRGITEEDKPYNGGKYINDTGDAGEKYNFVAFDDEFVYGYTEPGFTKGGYKDGKHKELHIENIGPSCIDSDHIDGVKVIMCAKDPNANKTVVVGWYENATVYREVKVFEKDDEQIWMITKCKKEDAHLIDYKERDFVVQRAKDGNRGFGQSNIWFANQEEDYDFRIKTLEYLNSKLK